MKSILMIGQSNMAGRGFINEVPMICNERILMLRNAGWQMMAEPINYDRPNAGIGLAGSFAAMWCMEHEGEQIGLIPCAEGGSSLDDWAVDKNLFKNAVIQAGFAMQDSELIGILWHQGESDSYGGGYQTYYKKLQVIIESLRKELNAFEVPLIIGGLGDFLGKNGFGLNCTEYELVNEQLLKFAREQENSCFVTAEGLTPNPDGIHMDAVSQRRFGVRYYEAFVKREHVLKPIENEIELLERCISGPHTKREKMYLAMAEFAAGKMTDEEFGERMRVITVSSEAMEE
ncbi:sialate O-acetylesterase [Mediterraneibacter gnavus]|uniref:Sialate O-acetylesterase n=1 Tax=Mediterraneibacter gnavus TaxID=33038 RepID=A0A9X3KAN4_MEDGN|nr:sialate O-acetylesterase [Mediterraneibacter gnavus]MCZ7693280.1 sialate O-acetylesterase [Mediterraneibacter gnavus]MCZ7735000.1 sialate O-acetylesterase [Mediterraneibacter gnavus]MDC6146495.1 sialate O-acetylesterase [Mediterraneibacter gnavus]MDE1199912.1 sialate O-acetylesterase [Mediterraneibacter gnavus]